MTGAPPRYPIEALGRLAPPAPVRIVGRVVDGAAEGVRVLDPTGSVVVLVGSRPAPGAWVTCHGEWDGERVRADALAIVGEPTAPFPAPQGDWRWFQDDAGRRARALRDRARIVAALREHLDAAGFVEVQTPSIVPCPGLDVHLDAFEVRGAPAPRWLATSPEYQMKRLLAGGLPRIYQIGPSYRRGERGARHEPEFTMLELYRTFADSEALMADTEALVAAAVTAHRGAAVVDGPDGPLDLTPPWERLSVEEAFTRHAGLSMAEALEDEERFFRVLVDRIEPALARHGPCFLTRWPTRMASLARRCPDDPSVADRFEAYVAGLELCNGFGELVDPVEQRERLERDQRDRAARGLPVYPIDERFLAALEEGLPPCAGNAIGVDRLVMLALGADDIADVIAFPARRL